MFAIGECAKSNILKSSMAEYTAMSTTAEADLSDVERAGLKLIRTTGGIHQSDFWKELDIDSRTGSRILD